MAVNPPHRPGGRWAHGLVTMALLATALLAGLMVRFPVPAGAQEVPVRLADEMMVLLQGESAVQVLHLFTLVNESQVPVALPALPVLDGAVRLQVLRLEPDGSGLPVVERVGPGEPPEDPEPLAPGEARRYQATYRLWQREAVLPLRRPLPYPTDGTLLLTRPGELEVTGVRVARTGSTEADGVELDLYQVEATGPVDRWQVVLRRADGEPLPVLAGAHALNPLASLPWAWVGWLLFGGGLAAALLRVVRRRRARRAPEADPLAPWVRRLAALDLAYQRGELPEETYRRRRQALLTHFRQTVSPTSSGRRDSCGGGWA